jgi:hypothetical protein
MRLANMKQVVSAMGFYGIGVALLAVLINPAVSTAGPVGAAGQDIYDVQFEHGSREFRILLELDGRIHAAEFSP